MNFTRILRAVARRFPDSDAVVTNEKTDSFSTLWTDISSVGRFYAENGLVVGDRVLLILPNCRQFLHLHFGALKTGVISVPVRYEYTGWEVSRLAANCQPRILVSTADWLEQHGRELRLPPSICVWAVEEVQGRLRAGDQDVLPLDSSTTASINYSYFGGGHASGAMLSHGNHIRAATGYARHQGFRRSDRVMVVLPMCHVYALSGCVNAGLVRGAALVLSDNHLPRGILGDIERHRVTIFSSIPAMFECLADYGRRPRFDLCSLRLLVTGGAYMSASDQCKYERALGVEMVQGYGLTECLPIICNPSGARNRRGTLGVPGRRDIHIRIVGSDGHVLPCGTVGDIQIRSTTTMSGYYGLEAESRSLFDGEWLRTGDLGTLDEDGYLYFHGMTKPIVNLYGNKVDPLEVREALLEHPMVAAAEVSGDYSGDRDLPACDVRLSARITCKEGSPPSAAELRSFCAARLARYKLPQIIAIDSTRRPYSAAAAAIERSSYE